MMRMGLMGRTGRLKGLTLGLALLLSLPSWSLPAAADSDKPSSPPVVGRLVEPEQGRLVVRRRLCHCDGLEQASGDVLLLTVGTETERAGELHFHPLASLAFDRTLSLAPDAPAAELDPLAAVRAEDEQVGQWMALWIYGPSPAGWRRTLHALLPLPVGAPSVSEEKLNELEKDLAELREKPATAELRPPDPLVHLGNLGRASRARGVLGVLRRGLDWAGVINPAQYLFRTYLERREDRRERKFKRAYVALHWLLSAEYTGEEEKPWLDAVNELRFHLLRDRSFFGRWVRHAEALELVYNYESRVRVQLGKASSWLQTAANEHYLRYQPVYRSTANGTASPVAGVLYYDPQLGVEADPAWWEIANPFDLPYNPHTHPAVQRLAEQYPDEWIPLAIYTFQTELPLKPIVAVDFFAPGNPRRRENSQQMMVLLKNWLALTTGTFALERIPYRLAAWGANKKGFTYLVDKSSRLGIEELRVALESELYFDPRLRSLLMRRADQRVLNPLVKAGPVEERLGHIQYESLLARGSRALCRRIEDLRREMADRLNVEDELPPAEQRRELARRLRAWNQQTKIEDFVELPPGDIPALAELEEPLEFFQRAEAPRPEELEELLAELYSLLAIRQLRLPASRSVPELEHTLALTRQTWKRVAGAAGKDFAARRADVEKEAQKKDREERRERVENRRKALRDFLEESHEQLERTAKAGCGSTPGAPAELDAHLVMLWEVMQETRHDAKLHGEFRRHADRLQRDLEKLETRLSACPPASLDSYRAERHRSFLEMAHALRTKLNEQQLMLSQRGD